jgi:hypothetical protein
MKTILKVPTPTGNVDIEVEVNENEFAKLAAAGFAQIATPIGYERAANDNYYYYVASDGETNERIEQKDESDLALYNTANYYSSEVLANNNARADRLMRQLRRFAVEHRRCDFDWKDLSQFKWSIGFEYNNYTIYTYNRLCSREFGVTYFDSQESAQAAIDTFYDELIWYFTEYRDKVM